MGHVPGVNFFWISQSPFQISLHYQDTLGSSLLNRPDYYYKMMTFENRVWMENDFGGPIF